MNNNDFDYNNREQVLVDLGYKNKTLCEVIEKAKSGYTKLLVEDVEPDIEVIITINNTWHKKTTKNYGKGIKHITHINKVQKVEAE